MPPNSGEILQRSSSNVGPLGTTKKIERARVLHEQGQLEAARVVYLEILEVQPDHFDALNMLGVLSGQSNDLKQAVQYFDRAIAAEPGNSMPYCNRGLALKQLNQLEAALASFDQAIALNHDDTVALYGRGNIYRELGDVEGAIASYDRVVAVNPSFAQAWYNRGVLLQQIQNWDAALTSYEQAIRANTDYVEAHVNKAAVLHHQSRFTAALASYDRAIELAPNYAVAYLHRGNALKELNQLEAALHNYDEAVKLQPQYAEAFSNRGVVLYELDRVQEALDSYSKAIAIKPEWADAYFNRASLLRAVQRFEDAAEDFAVAATLDPCIKFLPGAQIEARMQVCNWSGFDADVASIAAQVESDQPASHPFAFLTISDSPRLQKKCAEIWVHETCNADSSLGPIARRAQHGKIRVGYFSADFREHPVSRLLVELIETHDRSRFEVSGLSLGPAKSDEMSKRLDKAFDRFVDVRSRSNLDVASLARSLDIDIAVDLGGYTHNARPNIFALRAAPIQISYLGYLGTMGAAYMDYLVADATIVRGEDQQHYVEKIIYLPSYQSNDSRRQIANRTFTRLELGIPPVGFVYSCFNTNYKITPSTYAVWMRVLRRVERSILFIYADNHAARRNLLQEAQSAGVGLGRIIFGERLGLADYLARYQAMDLFLDTLPYNAGTTASDALWAGLPVLTCMGTTFAGRIAASLLRAIDLPELVATSLAEYEQLAVELGSNAGRMSEIKKKLAENRRTKLLFNQHELTKHLEVAYTLAHERYQAALPPDHIVVESRSGRDEARPGATPYSLSR